MIHQVREFNKHTHLNLIGKEVTVKYKFRFLCLCLEIRSRSLKMAWMDTAHETLPAKGEIKHCQHTFITFIVSENIAGSHTRTHAAQKYTRSQSHVTWGMRYKSFAGILQRFCSVAPLVFWRCLPGKASWTVEPRAGKVETRAEGAGGAEKGGGGQWWRGEGGAGSGRGIEGVQLAVTRTQYDTLSDNEIIKTAHQTTSAICWPVPGGRGQVRVRYLYWPVRRFRIPCEILLPWLKYMHLKEERKKADWWRKWRWTSSHCSAL